MIDALVEVAPREVHDLVYECCRILGLDGGVADDVATSVTEVEVRFGHGLAAFDDELTRLTTQGGSLLASAFVRGPDQWRDAELGLGGRGGVVVHLDPPAPLAALGTVLSESIARGVEAVGIATTMSGLDVIEEVELRLASTDNPPTNVGAAVEPQKERAMKRGLQLPSNLLSRLGQVAANFLVSEASVDAAIAETAPSQPRTSG